MWKTETWSVQHGTHETSHRITTREEDHPERATQSTLLRSLVGSLLSCMTQVNEKANRSASAARSTEMG